MRHYVLYDGRACGGVGTDDASVFVYCETAEEANEYRGDYGAMACYSYEVDEANHTLSDERWEWDYFDEE